MRCPHCQKESKAKVLESRSCDGRMWRRRACSLCFRNFVSVEMSEPDLRMPATANSWHRLKDVRPKPEDAGAIKSDASHLQGVWR